MITRKDKEEKLRRFSFFGWNIYITRDKLRRKDPARSRWRTKSKISRLIARDFHCELCGIPIDIRCHLWHILPSGCEGRNDVANVRVLCPKCNRHTQIIGVFRPMITSDKKGGER